MRGDTPLLLLKRKSNVCCVWFDAAVYKQQWTVPVGWESGGSLILHWGETNEKSNFCSSAGFCIYRRICNGIRFRIPEQSLDSTAKAGAAIASADSADVAYYNPAGMALMPDSWMVEGTATFLHLTAIEYEDIVHQCMMVNQQKKISCYRHFLSFHPIITISVLVLLLQKPYGLQKRWDDLFPRATAKKYGIKVFEMNPTVSYKINDMFSIGGGARFIYSEAKLRTDGAALGPSSLALDGDTTEWGWNVAVDAKVTDDLNIAFDLSL